LSTRLEDRTAYDVKLSDSQQADVLMALATAEQELHEILTEGEVEGMSAESLKSLQVFLQHALDQACHRLIERGDRRWWLAPNIYGVTFDDTVYWVIPDHLKPWIERIESVYLYDANTRCHLCEFTPSYELWFAENRAVCRDDTPDELREEIHDFVDHHVEERTVIYSHCHSVDAMKSRRHQGNPGVAWSEVEGDSEDARMRTIMEACIEGQRCNPWI
jgi:hypothetical protein